MKKSIALRKEKELERACVVFFPSAINVILKYIKRKSNTGR